MKKRYLFISLLVVLTGCGNKDNKNSVEANNSTPVSIEESVSQTISENNAASESESVQEELSSTIISEESSISISEETSIEEKEPSVEQPSVVEIEDSSSTPSTPLNVTVSEAIDLGKDLQEGEKGSLIQFTATYLKGITLSRSNEDLMMFASSDAYIYLRVPYTSYTGYLANRYEMNDYVVTANVIKNNGEVELVLPSNLEVRNCVVNVEGDYSCDLAKLAEKKNSIKEIIDDFNDIKLNKKYYGSGKVVTFNATLVATEYEEANKKASFYDGSNVINVINDKKIASKEDVGKDYQITGIMNVNVASPAILLLSIKEITKENKEVVIDKYSEISPSSFKNWNLTSDKFNAPSYEVYGTLYKTTGYVKDDTSRTSSYHIGVTEQNGTLSDVGIKTSIPGFYLANLNNVDERTLTYSAFLNYFVDETPVTFYFVILGFDTNNHAWNVLPLVKFEDSVEIIIN